MTIFSKETIKQLAVEAALQFTSTEQCNPFVNNLDASDLFKKYFEMELTYRQLETAIEHQHTDAISTTAAASLKAVVLAAAAVLEMPA